MVQGVVTSILSGHAWARSRGRIVTYLDDKTIQVERRGVWVLPARPRPVDLDDKTIQVERRGLDEDNGVTPVQAFFQMYDIVEWLEV